MLASSRKHILSETSRCVVRKRGLVHAEHTGVDRVVVVGTNTGGSLAICVGADDPRVHACGLLSPRADARDPPAGREVAETTG